MSGQPRGKDERELIAAAAVGEALGAKLIRRDTAGAQQTRDFDLVFEGSPGLEPLEVTTFASRPDIETWQRLDRLDEEISAPELTNDWYIDVGPPIMEPRTIVLDVRRLEHEVVGALAALELAGYDTIDYGQIRRDPTVNAAFQRLLELGVNGGHATPLVNDDSARVVTVASVGGFVHPDLVAAGIELEAAKSDNQIKLRTPSVAHRRHLVVIFDPSSGSAFTAVSQGLLGRVPILPAPITTAWALASNSLLGTTPPDPWTHRRIPDDVFDSPTSWQVA